MHTYVRIRMLLPVVRDGSHVKHQPHKADFPFLEPWGFPKRFAVALISLFVVESRSKDDISSSSRLVCGKCTN